MREDIPVRERCRFRNLALGTATLTTGQIRRRQTGPGSRGGSRMGRPRGIDTPSCEFVDNDNDLR